MMRRNFTLLALFAISIAHISIARGEDPQSDRVATVTEMPNCIAFWDFVKREPGGAKRFTAHVPTDATNEYPLDAANYVKDYWDQGREANYGDFPLLGRGPFGQAIRIRKESDALFRPFLFVPRSRLHDSPLDIKGNKSVTVVVWAIRESGNHALAGIWHEGTDLKEKSTASIKKAVRGQRQYALFAGLNKAGSACGHVSENGASSFLNKYALHKCNSADSSPAVPADSPDDVLDASWQCFAMTFDNERNEITGWLNGRSGDRWLENPKNSGMLSYAYNAWRQGNLRREPGEQIGEDANFPKDQFYNPPEGDPLSIKVLSETPDQRVEVQEFPYTRVKVTLKKNSEGKFSTVARDLVGLRLNPWWFPHDIYSPADATTGGPFTIGRVIHSSRTVGFTGWIGGVAVFDRALKADELNQLAELRRFNKIHVTQTGAGRQDGSDWQNAAAAEKLQSLLSEDARPGDQILLGSGKYPQLSVKRSGSPDHPITVSGVDTGQGLPSIAGRWKQTNPKYHAHSWGGISLAAGVSHVRIGGIKVSGFIYGVQASSNSDIELFDLAIARCREGISLKKLTDSTIRDCRMIGYTKRGIRFKEGCHDLIVTDVTADATGGVKDWPTEAFPFGFAVENGDGNHSIRYERCTARNNVFPGEPGKYWNGDGFLAENHSENLVYIDCMSFDNSDGGWDDKSRAPQLTGCVAARNKRGFRFWNIRGDQEHPARLKNCLGVFNKSAGGSGSSAGLWTCGAVEAEQCTFHGNATAAVAIESNRPGGKLLAVNCILSTDATNRNKSLVLKEGGTTYEARSVITFNGGNPDDDPQYPSPSPQWDGTPLDAFNSQRYGKSIGFWKERSGR